MQAVILAAGLGTRMGELTKDRPKPLLTIENKTLLEHNLLALPSEIDEVVLVVGYLAEQIKELVGDFHAGKKVTYVEQKELLGTGHALALCKDVLHGRFLVLMGDDLYERRDLEEMVKHPLSLLVYELEREEEGDNFALVITNGSGQPIDILERQPGKSGGLVNCGAYVLDERYFNLPLKLAGNRTSEYGLPQTMLQMIKNGAKFTVVKASFWHNVTGPEDLEIAQSVKWKV